MEEFFILLGILAAGCILSGPVALILSIINLNKLKELYRQPRPDTDFREKEKMQIPPVPHPQKTQIPPTPPIEQIETEQKLPPPETPETAKIEPSAEAAKQVFHDAAERIRDREKQIIIPKAGTLEQRIGTQWILIAGIITVIIGVAFFLKYAYDNFALSPSARVIIVACCGFAALVIGEITRRRGYDIVAKGVTALGFAILYTAVFSAYRFYGLIDSIPAFAMAIAITAAAMTYAVVLDEILIAFLSLLGGFLTPLLVSTGENLPIPLFTYTLILCVGAMLCAYYRKWRSVNWLAFIGTFALYTGWFEKFFRPEITKADIPGQMTVALTWLTVFFIIYLVMPLIYALVKKIKAQKEDVMLLLTNAAVTFYYLCTILFASHRDALAFSALGLSVIHLAMLTLVIKRGTDDSNLRIVLLAIALFFLTVALPLYLKMNALAMAWAAEAVILVIIGLRYRSLWTQVAAAVPLSLSCFNLLYHLPMHTAAFKLVFNPEFGTWCFVAAAACIYHIIYRKTSQVPKNISRLISQILYAVMGILLFTAAAMEWYWHCQYNLPVPSNYIYKGQLVIFAVTLLLFVLRPLPPVGIISRSMAQIVTASGFIYAIVFVFTDFHTASFRIFANLDFASVLVFISALIVYHLISRRLCKSPNDTNGLIAQFLYAAVGLLLFAAATMEWYSHCLYNLQVQPSIYYISKAQLIIFSVIVLIFAIRPLCPQGLVCQILSLFMLVVGSVYTLNALTNLHETDFLPFINPDFIFVIIFIAALLFCHLKYRQNTELSKNRNGVISQILYGGLGLLLLAAFSAEWYWHCKYNLANLHETAPILKGQVIIFAIILLFFVTRPICPLGKVSKILACLLAAAGAVFTVLTFPKFYNNTFMIFANFPFLIVIAFVVSLFLAAWLLSKQYQQEKYTKKISIAFALAAVFILWVLLTEQVYLYWKCKNLYAQTLHNWSFLAHMYISITWALYGAALMIIGFWKNLRILRYLAIGLFALLLIKVFILDTRNIENVYRIAAFLATGVTLVGVSYLYQFLKKKGFFDGLLIDKTEIKQ